MDSTNRDAAGRVADSMKDKLGDIAAEAARTAVESNLDQAAAAVEDRYGAVLDPAAKVAGRLSETAGGIAKLVRARPVATLLAAAAVGFAIGRAA